MILALRILYFEDLSVGMTETLSKTIASSDVVGFAQLTGDRNPIHLSEHFAAKTQFGKRIAHGLYTASLISAVLGTRLPGPGAIYVSQTLNFHAPVQDRRPGGRDRHGGGAHPRAPARAAHLHLQGRRRDRARRRGAGEGALRRPNRNGRCRGFERHDAWRNADPRLWRRSPSRIASARPMENARVS